MKRLSAALLGLAVAAAPLAARANWYDEGVGANGAGGNAPSAGPARPGYGSSPAPYGTPAPYGSPGPTAQAQPATPPKPGGGCLKYGAAGALAGHLAGHGVLGAMAGCATGAYIRHRDKERIQEQYGQTR